MAFKNEAEETMLGLIITDNHFIPIITDNCNVSSYIDNGVCMVKIGIDLTKITEQFNIKIGDKINDACFDFTNDPTNNVAGGVVSLGYYVLRFEIRKGEVVSLNPLTFQCKEDDFKVLFTRPQRNLYESEEQILFEKMWPSIRDNTQKLILNKMNAVKNAVEEEEEEIKIEKATEVPGKKGMIKVEDWIIGKLNSELMHIVKSRWDKDKEIGCCFIEKIDPRTYFKLSDIIIYREYDNINDLRKQHEILRKKIDWRGVE